MSDMDYDEICKKLRSTYVAPKRKAARPAADAIDRILARVAELEAENGRLRTALHDAIDRPKGVVPDSAESFYEPMRCLQAEAQRMGLYGGSEG